MINELGIDRSGNNNNWTVNNMTLAADQMVDSPTNNFCTLNPNSMGWTEPAADGTISEANLKISNITGGWFIPRGSIGVSSGKWYFEVNTLRAAKSPSYTYMQLGIEETIGGAESSGNSYRYRANGNKYWGAGATSYGATWGTGDIIGVAMNLDDNEVTFYKNNASQGAESITANKVYNPVIATAGGAGDAGELVANFGQDSSFAGSKTAQGNQDSNGIGDFYYTPPTDFLALCTSNLPAVAVVPSEHFNTILYDDGAGAKTGVGFQPDLVWLKSRGSTFEHEVTDAVRGVTKAINPDNRDNETTESTGLTAFGADGFTVGADNDYDDQTGDGMVAWCWKGANATVTNTVGNEDTTVSANPDAGFSIVKWTNDGDEVGTRGHGLSKAPEMIITKTLNCTGDNGGWGTYHEAMGNTNSVRLDITTDIRPSTIMNDTTPTATYFSVGTPENFGDGNITADMIAYCFHSVDGYSKMGGYTGNANADGTFVYTGFRPAWVMLKFHSTTSAWTINDSVRDPENVVNITLRAEGTEIDNTTMFSLDFLANGFKLRDSGSLNSAEDGIFIAFAETPFKYSNAR